MTGRSPLIEYNFVDSAGQLGKAGTNDCNEGTCYIGAIWPNFHKSGVIQHNEVSNTKMWYGDGCAFDNDYYLMDTTIFQYNYSHDNDGEFFMDASFSHHDSANVRSIVRYNISQNDGQSHQIYHDTSATLKLERDHALIYNNVFYSRPGGIFSIFEPI